MAIKKHRNYDADDYAYLRAKGWSDAEILARWSDEARQGKPACQWEGWSRQKLQAVVTARR